MVAASSASYAVRENTRCAEWEIDLIHLIGHLSQYFSYALFAYLL